jgi:hypothetical protein
VYTKVSYQERRVEGEGQRLYLNTRRQKHILERSEVVNCCVRKRDSNIQRRLLIEASAKIPSRLDKYQMRTAMHLYMGCKKNFVPQDVGGHFSHLVRHKFRSADGRGNLRRRGILR